MQMDLTSDNIIIARNLGNFHVNKYCFQGSACNYDYTTIEFTSDNNVQYTTLLFIARLIYFQG